MDCREFQLFVHAWLDDELEPMDAAPLEAHLSTCTECAALARENAGFRRFIRESFEPEVAPESLRLRIVDVLEAQDAVELAHRAPGPPGVDAKPQVSTSAPRASRGARFRAVEWVLGPAVATALLVLLVLLAVRQFDPSTERTHESLPAMSTRATSAAPLSMEGAQPASAWGPAMAPASSSSLATPIVEEAVTWHRRNLPVEVTGPSDARVRRWFDGKVNFPVRLPQFEKRAPGQVQLLGARLSNVKERQAAYVVYEVDGKKMSVMAFDGRDIPRPSRDRGEPIYFENSSGYNVAVIEDNGITYSITSEMPQKEMVELVETVFSEVE